jgi:hypothetical protein
LHPHWNDVVPSPLLVDRSMQNPAPSQLPSHVAVLEVEEIPAGPTVPCSEYTARHASLSRQPGAAEADTANPGPARSSTKPSAARATPAHPRIRLVDISPPPRFLTSLT